MPQSATESWAWHDSQPHPCSSPTPETTPSSRRHPPTPTKEFTSLWQPSMDPPHQHHHRESKPHPGIPSSESQALPNSLQTCGMPIWHSSTHSRSTEPSSGASTSSKTLTSYNKSSRLQHTSQPGTIGPKHLGSCQVSSTSMISQLSMSGVNKCASPSCTRQSRGSCQQCQQADWLTDPKPGNQIRSSRQRAGASSTSQIHSWLPRHKDIRSDTAD